jgi:hypothetical protein
VSEANPVTITGNTLIFNYRAGDVTYHSDVHVHVHESSRPPVEDKVVVHRYAQTEPPRPVDERCEQGRKEHEERVRRWKAFPEGY